MQEKGITRYLWVLASMKQKLTHRRTKKPDRPPDGNLGTGTKAKVLLQGLQLIRMEYDFLNGNTNMVPSRKKKWQRPDQVNFQMKKNKWLIQKNVFQLH